MTGGLDRFGKSYGDVTNEGYVERIARIEAEQREKNAMRFKQSMRLRNEFMNTEHNYQMYYGDVPVGAVMKMPGREAVKRNKALELKFIAALDAGKSSPRLGKWMYADQPLGKNRERWIGMRTLKKDCVEVSGVVCSESGESAP